MNLAFVINSKYLGQCKVTLRSIFDSNAGETFHLHILCSGLSEEDRTDLTAFIERFGADITFYDIDEGIFAGLPKMKGDSGYTAYYKVLLPYYLRRLDKALYLDCDLIVRGKLSPLYEKSGSFLFCASDEKINRKRKEHVLAIIGKEIPYFNSGVMLFDFSRSEIAPLEEVLAYLIEARTVIRWHDQDILNHFYAERCTIIEKKYNYLTTYESVGDLFLQRGKREAVIVHYANWKPWEPDYIGKCHALYRKYYRLCKGERGVNYLRRRNPLKQLGLILRYLLR